MYLLIRGTFSPKQDRESNMFNRRDKIIKKAGEKPTDLEEEVAKSLGVTLDKDLDLAIEMGQMQLDLSPNQPEQPARSRKRKKSS